MSWIAVLLIGCAIADLVHSARPVRVVPEATGAVVAVLVGLLAGLTDPLDLLALVVIAAVVLAWGQAVTHGFAHRIPVWVPLLVLAGGIGTAVLVSGAAGKAGGAWGAWLEGSGLPALAEADPDRALLLVAAFLVQLSTGNVIVRLVLAATGTADPDEHGSIEADPSVVRLKGGRLLGPMERVFILALALAGQITAASIVVAAKGLLRFPELSSRGEQERIHQLTEYFLVGSFISWLVALGSLLLLSV
jgi:hypothetical protein